MQPVKFPLIAYRLLRWIRTHKKELAQATLPANQQNDANVESLRRLRNHLAAFDRNYRGASCILSGRDRPPHSYFLRTATNQALSLIGELTEREPILVGPVWDSLRGLSGMNEDEFKVLAETFFMRKVITVMQAFPHAEWMMPTVGRIHLKLKNGHALNEVSHQFPCQYTSATIGEQLGMLKTIWKRLREDLRAILKDPKNWPSDAHSDQAGRELANELAARMMRSLTAKEHELLKAYPQALTSALNQAYLHRRR